MFHAVIKKNSCDKVSPLDVLFKILFFLPLGCLIVQSLHWHVCDDLNIGNGNLWKWTLFRHLSGDCMNVEKPKQNGKSVKTFYTETSFIKQSVVKSICYISFSNGFVKIDKTSRSTKLSFIFYFYLHKRVKRCCSTKSGFGYGFFYGELWHTDK